MNQPLSLLAPSSSINNTDFLVDLFPWFLTMIIFLMLDQLPTLWYGHAGESWQSSFNSQLSSVDLEMFLLQYFAAILW